MAAPSAGWSEAVLAAVAGVPVLGLIVVYLRGRAEIGRQVERATEHADRRIDAVCADLNAHRVEVAQTRASVDYVAAVERRVGERLDRLEDSMSGRFDKLEGLLLGQLQKKGRPE